MMVILVILWMCNRLSAPFWCYALIWIYMTMKMVVLASELMKEKKGKDEYAGKENKI